MMVFIGRKKRKREGGEKGGERGRKGGRERDGGRIQLATVSRMPFRVIRVKAVVFS